jgi:sugar O-acyltransferase (sialic acid O-acetyltransferase NeuD family)
MKELLIIGAHGWGREVCDIAKACIKAGMELTVKGFLDDRTYLLDGYDNYPPILGSVDSYEIQENDVFVCALGDVNFKKRYIDTILQRGGSFISLIHPTAIIGNNATMGTGCIIGAYANLSSDTRIGNFVTICLRAGLGHDTVVGDYSHIGGNSCISGYVTIGESVTIHPGCVMVPKRKIGDHAVAGTGSVILCNVKAGTTVLGNPATKIDI